MGQSKRGRMVRSKRKQKHKGKTMNEMSPASSLKDTTALSSGAHDSIIDRINELRAAEAALTQGAANEVSRPRKYAALERVQIAAYERFATAKPSTTEGLIALSAHWAGVSRLENNGATIYPALDKFLQSLPQLLETFCTNGLRPAASQTQMFRSGESPKSSAAGTHIAQVSITSISMQLKQLWARYEEVCETHDNVTASNLSDLARALETTLLMLPPRTTLEAAILVGMAHHVINCNPSDPKNAAMGGPEKIEVPQGVAQEALARAALFLAADDVDKLPHYCLMRNHGHSDGQAVAEVLSENS